MRILINFLFRQLIQIFKYCPIHFPFCQLWTFVANKFLKSSKKKRSQITNHLWLVRTKNKFNCRWVRNELIELLVSNFDRRILTFGMFQKSNSSTETEEKKTDVINTKSIWKSLKLVGKRGKEEQKSSFNLWSAIKFTAKAVQYQSKEFARSTSFASFTTHWPI